MAVVTTPTVTLYAYGVSIDLTDRALGARIKTRAPIGQLGETSGTLDLDNNDGALTPGGGGTYAATDWFAHAIQLSADVDDGTTSHTVRLGDGIITEFEIIDDGVNSFVRIGFDDGLTVGGTSLTSLEFTGTTGQLSPKQALEAIYSGQTLTGYNWSGAALPALGHPDGVNPAGTAYEASVKFLNLAFGTMAEPTSADWDIDASVTFSAPAKDFLNTTIMPSGPFTAYPTIIETQTFILGSTFYYARYLSQLLGPWTIRKDDATTVGGGFRFDFVFDESPGAGELPFEQTVRRYNSDELVNDVAYTSLPTGGGVVYDVTAQNTASVNAYGSRARYIKQGLARNPATFPGEPKPFMEADGIATRYANMTADATYHLHQLKLTAKMVEVKATASVDAWAHLLDIRDGLYQHASVNYTPTGAGSQQTVTGVIYSRTISLTPSDITVGLELYPAGVLAGFILDDALLGVIDQNMLG